MQKQNVGSLFNQFSFYIPEFVDHKIFQDDDEIVYHNLNKCSLITTSAWRNSNNAEVGSVGILIIEIVLADVRSFDNNKQIMISEFKGNPATTIIVHYSPVEGSPEQEHYNSLSRSYKWHTKTQCFNGDWWIQWTFGKRKSYVFIPWCNQ